jgi:hypothetical protein
MDSVATLIKYRMASAAIFLQFLDTPRVAAAQENILQSQQMSFQPSVPIQGSIALQKIP